MQDIPEFLVSDLMLLFPGVSVQGEGLNVITLSQRTLHDMTSWSAEVEQEREQLLEHVGPLELSLEPSFVLFSLSTLCMPANHIANSVSI